MSGAKLALRLGWRNLWRNARRSLITIGAIGAAFAFLIVIIGLMGGLREQMLRNGTRLMLGHIQLHHAEYFPDRNINDTLEGSPNENLEAFMDRLVSMPGIETAAPRVQTFGLLSTGEFSAGAQLLGLDPDRESRLTTILHELDVGRGLDTAGGYSLLLGTELARELNAVVGSEVAVVCQAADGSMGNALFTVVGIVRTGLRNLDRSLALAHYADLQDLLVLDPERIHELALAIDDPQAADRIAAALNAGLLPERVEARSWGDLAPQLRDYLALSEGSATFVIALVALFAALGVLNTMMMAIFERTREFGILNAIGMKPGLLLRSLLAESLFLALLGLALGLLAGSIFLQHMSVYGWDLSAWTGELSLMDARVDPILRGVWVWDQIAWAAAGLAISTLLAALIPGRRVFTLDPVEAMTAPTEG
jgi:ABC-type lipoprotein release transport system permease subunit